MGQYWQQPWSAVGYIATGAVAGVVSLSPGGAFAASKITAAGNILTDIASGNVPDINSTSDLLGYAGSTIGNALDVAGSGRLAKLGANGLKSFGIYLFVCFGWTSGIWEVGYSWNYLLS